MLRRRTAAEVPRRFLPWRRLGFLAVALAGALAVRAAAPPPKVQAATRSTAPSPGQNQFYDPSNPDYATLQKANESLAGFPVDRQGYVDWMSALNGGLIQPVGALNGQAGPVVMDLDVVMKDTREMPYVVFPHRSHTLWLDCANCHPAIFQAKAGANPVSMSEIFRGRYCGVCHDRVAFITFFSCDRCHRIAHYTPPPEPTE